MLTPPSGLTYTEAYRSGDVCDRRRGRIKGAKRSGSGRNFARRQPRKKFRAPQQDITGLTRNIVGSVMTDFPKLHETRAFSPFAFAILKTRISQFSRNLVTWLLPLQFNTEAYRSGHNGTDSKSVVRQRTVGSNPTASANAATTAHMEPQSSNVLRLFILLTGGI